MALLLLFIAFVIWGLSNHDAVVPRSDAMSKMIRCKYPFSDWLAGYIADIDLKHARQKVACDPKRAAMIECQCDDEELAIVAQLVNCPASDAGRAERSKLMEMYYQHHFHRNGNAYIPSGLSIYDMYREYPEFARYAEPDRARLRRSLEFSTPGTPKHPDIWEAEKKWLKEYQGLQSTVERWDEYARYIGYSIPYPYNKEDADRIAAEKREKRKQKLRTAAAKIRKVFQNTKNTDT